MGHALSSIDDNLPAVVACHHHDGMIQVCHQRRPWRGRASGCFSSAAWDWFGAAPSDLLDWLVNRWPPSDARSSRTSRLNCCEGLDTDVGLLYDHGSCLWACRFHGGRTREVCCPIIWEVLGRHDLYPTLDDQQHFVCRSCQRRSPLPEKQLFNVRLIQKQLSFNSWNCAPTRHKFHLKTSTTVLAESLVLLTLTYLLDLVLLTLTYLHLSWSFWRWLTC